MYAARIAVLVCLFVLFTGSVAKRFCDSTQAQHSKIIGAIACLIVLGAELYRGLNP